MGVGSSCEFDSAAAAQYTGLAKRSRVPFSCFSDTWLFVNSAAFSEDTGTARAISNSRSLQQQYRKGDRQWIWQNVD